MEAVELDRLAAGAEDDYDRLCKHPFMNPICSRAIGFTFVTLEGTGYRFYLMLLPSGLCFG